MCNRYRADFQKLSREERERLGVFEEISEIKIDIFPDRFARVLTAGMTPQIMRWGMPGPAKFGGAPVTNVRNLSSPHWRAWLKPENRCLVPFTSFSEYEDASPKGKKVLRWFAPAQRPYAMFAGIWTTWHGARGTKANPETGEHKVFGFLTTEANDVVRPIHAKAMPLILDTPEEWAHWLTAPAENVPLIQARPQPNENLTLALLE
jgi:putative SOS response-associated peptidase YedK